MNVNVNLMKQSVIHINGGITINVSVSVRNIIYVQKKMFGILVHVIVKMENEVIDADSKVIPKDDNDETETIPTNLNQRKVTSKMQNFYILLTFLLITIELWIAISIYCYLMKYNAKQKQLVPFYVTNNKFKKFCIESI